MKAFSSYLLCIALLLTACKPQVPADSEDTGNRPLIYPEYTDVTIPPNIAPLHFRIERAEGKAVTRFACGEQELIVDGADAKPSESEWKQLLQAARGKRITVDVYYEKNGRWMHDNPFCLNVAEEEIDPYLSYRLIAPSYVTYEDLTLNQRCLTDYSEKIIYSNMLLSTEQDGQCVNCHAYQGGNPQQMQFHVRNYLGGTVLARNGKVEKIDLKTDSTLSAGVYPAWHPSLPFIAYSTNKTGQAFHTRDAQKIEVQDTQSDLILYDIERNEVSTISREPDALECFPTWSPDGRYLYYCSARFHFEYPEHPDYETITKYQDIKYSLYRRAFDAATRTFGPEELVYDAAAEGKSATLPRLSPDGRFLMFTQGAYGVFHIWHKDADLYLMELASGRVRPLTEINSPDVESYHSWSTNGRWVVFSSRRNDGNYTRPFIAYIDKDGRGHKPFELPQDDPDFHRQFLRSYNIPEFMTGPVTVSAQNFADVIRRPERKASYRKNQ